MTSDASIADLETPTLLLDVEKLDRNIARLGDRLTTLGTTIRPHIKTVKSAEIWRRALGEPGRVTVSTLKEAEHAFANGVGDILYAVAVSPNKLARAIALKREGADLTLTVDTLEAADAVARAGAAAGVDLPAVVEIDCDNRRAGVAPASGAARAIAARLSASDGAAFRGLMTHAGGSYGCRSPGEIRAVAAAERASVVDTAAMLAEAGIVCEMISVGSTPTAFFGDNFDGVTEVRAGVYMTMDLVMAGLGVCRIADIALSVLASVIGRQPDRGEILIDAGWMALSRDRGTADQAIDQGYGLVCDHAGSPISVDGAIVSGGGQLIVTGANQEHGIVTRRDGGPIDPDAFPIGRMLRVLPNHACATAAQFGEYVALDAVRNAIGHWPRENGW